MDKIIFGIPSRRVVHRVTLTYAALIMQEAPIEKGKAFKMQLSDPAIELMHLNLDIKSSIAVASVGSDIFLIPLTTEIKKKVQEKDICMVYADGSISNRRLYMYLSKLFSLDNSIKNTFVIERTLINSGVPGIEPVVMYKLIKASQHDTEQGAPMAQDILDMDPELVEPLPESAPIGGSQSTRSQQDNDQSSSLPPNEVDF